MKKIVKIGAMAAMVFSATGVFAEVITKPHNFTADTDAKAEEVNANFDLLYKKVNDLLAIVRPTSSSAAEALLRTITMPKNVTSASGLGSATISWNAVDGATSYTLYMATETGVNASNYATKANGQMIPNVTSPYIVQKLTNGKTYYFSVVSVTPVGESVASLEVNAVPTLNSTEVINPANMHRYFMLINADKTVAKCTWKECEQKAVALGGHLATINDAAENEWVRQTFQLKYPEFWIGLNDDKVEGKFEWVSGESSTYTKWNSGEPNNAGGDEDYVHFHLSGYWNDNLSVATFPALVEVPVSITVTAVD